MNFMCRTKDANREANADKQLYNSTDGNIQEAGENSERL